MAESDAGLHRAQARYWNQTVELKGLAVLIRLYRDDQARWISRLGIVKALAASSTIAGWSIWKDYALVWGIILALSQLLDAIKEYLPSSLALRRDGELSPTISEENLPTFRIGLKCFFEEGRALARNRDAGGGRAIQMTRRFARRVARNPPGLEQTLIAETHEQRIERAGLQAGLLR